MGACKRSAMRMAWRLSKLHRRFDDLHRHADFSSARLRAHHVALTLEHHPALGPLEFHRKADQLPERAGGRRCPEEHARRADVARDALGVLQEYRQCSMNPLPSSSFRLFCNHRPRNPPGVSRVQTAKSMPLHGATREPELLSCSGRNTMVAGAFLLVACRRNVLLERRRAAGNNRSAATASGAAGRPALRKAASSGRACARMRIAPAGWQPGACRKWKSDDCEACAR